MTHTEITDFEMKEKLMKNISFSNPCWDLNNFSDNGYGYPRLTYNGKLWLAHRLSFYLYRGTIPENMCVLHKCDNRKCINPEHLFLGTQTENHKDMHKKGRAPTPEKIAHRMREIVKRGENNITSKLTEKQVIEIRENYDGSVSLRKIGLKYGVSDSTIHLIIKRITWKHLL